MPPDPVAERARVRPNTVTPLTQSTGPHPASGLACDPMAMAAEPSSPGPAPLIAECFANLECKVADTRLVSKYKLFVLEVLKAWTNPAQQKSKTIHHHAYGSLSTPEER